MYIAPCTYPPSSQCVHYPSEESWPSPFSPFTKVLCFAYDDDDAKETRTQWVCTQRCGAKQREGKAFNLGRYRVRIFKGRFRGWCGGRPAEAQQGRGPRGSGVMSKSLRSHGNEIILFSLTGCSGEVGGVEGCAAIQWKTTREATKALTLHLQCPLPAITDWSHTHTRTPSTHPPKSPLAIDSAQCVSLLGRGI